ncbi:MAG: hypothetical protein LBE84_09420 [Planctomycetota bacterium]|jgi:hypothetical protein|nr:hypothetical protein [Planctomycetota bacterium]
MAAQSETKGGSIRAPAWRRLIEWLDWRINPVLLRDLALYSRGRLAAIAYLLTLATLVLTAVLYAIGFGQGEWDREGGALLLSLIATLLSVVCGAIVPNLAFERFRGELANRATELVLMSPLTPARLVLGKLSAAWCVSLVALSMSAPMFATAYLLGGVNPLTILGMAAGVVMAGAIMPTPQLFLASWRRARVLSRFVSVLAFLAQLTSMILYVSFLNYVFVESFAWPEFLILAVLIIIGVLVAQFLYFATVSRLESEAVNRDAVPRISLAVAVYLGGYAALSLVRYGGMTIHAIPIVRFEAWWAGMISAFAAHAFCLGFLAIACTSPATPRHLLKNMKKRRTGLFFLLPFIPGLKSLTAYFLLNAAAVIGHALAHGDQHFLFFVLAPFQAIAYGLLAYFYLAVRLARNKRDSSLLPTAVILINLFLFLATIAIFSFMAIFGEQNAHPLILAATPLGLFIMGVTDSAFFAPMETGFYGMVFLALATAMLLPIFLANIPKLLGMAEDGDASR